MRTEAVPTGSGTPHSWAVLSLLCAAMFLVILDSSIVNVALPSMGRALAMGPGQLQLVLSMYTLLFGGLLLLGGRASDLLGRRRVFVTGLVAFAGASLLGGLAWSGPVLIVARAVQGAAAAVVAPSVLALITTTFAEGSPRNRALGVLGAVQASGFSAGLLLGGGLTHVAGWRWVLLINIPIAILLAALAPLLLRESRGTRQRLDLPGALTGTGGMAALVYAFSRAQQVGWTSAQVWGLLLLAAVLLAAFLTIESRSTHPLVRLSLLRHRTRAGADLVAVLFGATLLPALFILTLYLQHTLGYSALTTGLVLLPHGLLVLAAGPVVSRLTDRVGPLPPMIGGAVLLAAGMWQLTHIAGGVYLTVVLPGTLLLGLGVSCMIIAAVIAATSGVDDSEQGLASGLFNTAQQIGASLGLGILSAIATITASHPSSSELDGYQQALTAGITFPACAFLIALAISFTTRRQRDRRR